MTWKTNREEAEQMLAHADEVEWETKNYDLADRLRQMAEKLMENPDHREPPF